MQGDVTLARVQPYSHTCVAMMRLDRVLALINPLLFINAGHENR